MRPFGEELLEVLLQDAADHLYQLSLLLFQVIAQVRALDQFPVGVANDVLLPADMVSIDPCPIFLKSDQVA